MVSSLERAPEAWRWYATCAPALSRPHPRFLPGRPERGAGPEGGFVQVPVATAGGAKMIQGMQRYTDLDAATPPETRVVIDYGDI